MARTSLKDYDWEKIKLLLPHTKGSNGRPYKSHRPILEDIIWKLRTEPLGDMYRNYSGSGEPFIQDFTNRFEAKFCNQFLMILQKKLTLNSL